MNTLCNEFQYMFTTQQYEEDLDCEDETPVYFGGIYTIWKANNPIYINYFIYKDYEANTEYKADKLLWEQHSEDFIQNRFISICFSFR